MILPISAALDTEDIAQIPPLVREHLIPQESVTYTGTMHQVWRTKGWRGIIAWFLLQMSVLVMNALMADVGTNIPFRLTNTIKPFQDQLKALSWSRTFVFPHKTRHFNSYMTYEPKRSILCEWVGEARIFGFALDINRSSNGVILKSQYAVLRLGPLWIPLHRLLVGSIVLQVHEHDKNQLSMSMVLSHAALGDFYGYEGIFSKDIDIETRQQQYPADIARTEIENNRSFPS